MNRPIRPLAAFALMFGLFASVGCTPKPSYRPAENPTDHGMVIPQGIPGESGPKANLRK